MATLQTLLSQQMIERLGWTLIHFVWQATAVALMLAVVLRCLRRSSSNTRYIVSCLAMVLIVALTLVTMSLVEVSRPVAEAGPTLGTLPMSVTPVEVIELAQLRIESFDAPVPAMPERAIRVPWTQRAANALEPALPWLVSGWLLGVFGLSAWHLGGWAQLQRMKRRMVRQVAEPLHASLADLSNRLGVRHAVGLLESALVEVPTVVGWLKPVILLPASALSGLTTEQLEAILAHELAHVRRCDYLVNLAQTVVEILGFYHPAVWWISHRIRDERENCCDDVAVGVCGDSRRYARALTCLEELRHHSTELAVAASGGSLVARIARLLGRPPIDNRRFAWLPGLIALLVVAAILIPTALVLAAPETTAPTDTSTQETPSDATTPKLTTQTLAVDRTSDRPTVLVSFLLFTNPMPNKIVDIDTRRRIAEILAPEVPPAREGLAAMQNATVAQILQTWVAGRLLTPYTTEFLVDVLQSRGYLEREATPEILVNDNVPGHMNLITEELFLPAEDPTSSPKLVKMGTFVQVTPHVPPAPSDRITLEIAAEWKSRIKQSDPNENPTIRSTEIASTVTVLKNHYFTLLAQPDGTSDSEDVANNFHLLIFRADLFEPSLTDATTPTPPARASKTLSRQIILDVQTVSVAKDSLADGIVEWGRPQTGGWPMGIEMGYTGSTNINSRRAGGWPMGIEMGYTPDQTVTDALRKHLDELYAQGLARRLAHQRLTTQDGYKARFKAVKEEWFSLTPPQTQNAGAPQAEHTSIASGTIITATPTISDANNITLHLNVEFSESLPKAEGSDLPIVTRRTVRNVVTVRDGGTVLLAGLSSPYPDPTTEIAILVTARLAPETEPVTQQDRPLPQTVPPSEPAAIHTPVPSPPPVATVEPSADETDRQVLLSFTIAEVPSRQILDRETAILVRTLLATEARENYTAPRLVQLRQPLRRVFREHLADPNLSGDTIKAVLDVLISNGYGQILSTPKLLTTNRRWARIILGNAPSRNASATSDRDRSFGMNLDVTPTIRHAQDIISLGLDITFRDAFLALDDKTRTQRDESLPKRHRIEESRLSLFRIDTPNERYAFVSLASAAERLDAQGDFHLPVLLVKPTLIEPAAAPALAPSASEQATADAAREFEFVRTDPVVQMLMQRITEVEIELLEAQQTFLPEHPEIVQKKQLLEALNTHLEKRHRWLEQEFQAGRTSVAAPDDPAQQRANAETVLAILRQDLARVDEEIDKADSAWYPDEAERSRELKNLKQHKEVIEGQAQEIARIIEEQFGPPAEPEPYQISETDRSAERMRHLGLALRLYADSHDGRYPDDLLPLDPYLSLEDSRWIETSVVYSGKGRTANDESDTPIAYDRSVLEKTGSTLSVFADGQIRSIPVEALTPPHRKTNAVEVEARFVLVDRECLEAMQRGLPIKGVAAPADVNALHEIGADIVEGRTPVLEPDEVELLLKAVRQYTASKMLATPRVIVADAESASIRIGGPMDYISGYREPDGASHQPIPQNASKETGVRFDVTPYLIEDPNSIRLQFDMEITSLLATQKALYQGKYEYDIPTFTTVTVDTEIVIPNGQTALIHAGSIRSLGGIGRDEGDPPAPMLMLIKPTIAAVPPPAPAAPMPDKRRPGDPGMGTLPPGTNLW
ncbi:M56 family metallopeptidase [Anaerobaca lacustris]|uniref:M56 family metallopeptidase n=1 Tax=Anaerobaca lacustris TaxID=3044600 RepID=A0AAW6TWX4_9BACT|nr:M56 family metallopeptidase [Sedimentisphaerales bacterium M17dextr]